MSYTLQGIGTTFIGKRDFRSDDSYVTTEWIVIFYIPIVPIRSMRVIETGGEDNSHFPFLSRRKSYSVLAKSRPHWRQVLYVYGFAIFYIAWIVGYLELSTHIEKALGYNAGLILWFVALALPLPIPFFMRRYADPRTHDSCTTSLPPNLPGLFKFSCPHCRHEIPVIKDLVGVEWQCPTCKRATVVPLPKV